MEIRCKQHHFLAIYSTTQEVSSQSYATVLPVGTILVGFVLVVYSAGQKYRWLIFLVLFLFSALRSEHGSVGRAENGARDKRVAYGFCARYTINEAKRTARGLVLQPPGGRREGRHSLIVCENLYSLISCLVHVPKTNINRNDEFAASLE